MNLLLVFVPLGLVAGERRWDSASVFTLNFLAIIPLAAILSFATEELAQCLGETLGGLINATFGNAVELIVRFPLPEQRSRRMLKLSLQGHHRRTPRQSD